MSTSEQLLREYAQTKSEAAFAEIVRRHVDLVYGSALRLLREPAAAEDVTQTTFAELALTAKQFAPGMAVAGWLYRHACFTALKTLRGDRRRQSREIAASTMTAPAHTPEHAPEIEALTNALDETVHELEQADRDAIVLRYFEKRGLREVGEALGVSEDTAQKRVSRAVDKLRDVLERRGFAITGSALAVVLVEQSVQAAPLGLAAKIATAAASGAGSTLGSLWKLAAAMVLGGFLVSNWPFLQHSLSAFTNRNIPIQTQIVAARSAIAGSSADPAELERLRKEHSELLTLRGESTLMRDQLTTLSNQLAAVIAGNAMPSMVLVEARFISAPLSVLTARGFRAYPEFPHGLTADEARRMVAALEQKPDVKIFTLPAVSTPNGKSVILEMPERPTVQTAKGNEELRTTVTLTPTVLPDRQTIKVALNPQSQWVMSYEPDTGLARVADGMLNLGMSYSDHTSFLGATRVRENQPNPDGTTPLTLVVLITVHLADENGQLFHPLETANATK